MGRAAIAARFEQVITTARKELLVFDRPPHVAEAGRSENVVQSLLRDEVVVRGIYAPGAPTRSSMAPFATTPRRASAGCRPCAGGMGA